MEDFKCDHKLDQKSNTVYIFDTNCLLDYAYKDAKRAEWFAKKLKSMRERGEIRYSHQVLLEFKSHSEHANPKAEKSYKYIKNNMITIKDIKNNIKALVGAYKEPVDPDSCKNRNNISALNRACKDLDTAYKELNSCFNEPIPSNYGNNEQLINYLHTELPLLESYSDIIEKYEWITEGFVRVSHNIPPAYQDSYNKRFPFIRGKASSEKRKITPAIDTEEAIRYLGDFFIWKEILKSLRKKNSLWQKHVVFITNDEKSEWFIKEKKVSIKLSRNRNTAIKNIRSELKEEFKAIAERNGNNADIELLTLKEWESKQTEQSNIQNVVDEIREMINNEKCLNELMESWQLKDKVSDEFRDRVQLKIYNDSSYANGMYMDDVDIEDFSDLDVSIEEIYPEDGKYYISGVASIEAIASIYAYYNEDNIGRGADEIFDYPVSGTFKFQVEFELDENKMSHQGSGFSHSEIMDQIQTNDANTELEDPDITIANDVS